MAHARAEAEQILAKAKDDTEQLVKRRQRMAEDKIAAAERAAIAEVRAKAADAATRAAAALIAERNDAEPDKALVDRTIANMGRAASGRTTPARMRRRPSERWGLSDLTTTPEIPAFAGMTSNSAVYVKKLMIALGWIGSCAKPAIIERSLDHPPVTQPT